MSNKKNLREYFPTIRTREELQKEIISKPKLKNTFDDWAEEEQEEFLDICTGVKGLKITYDPYFKEIFNPEYDNERLSELLSCILNRMVKVITVLPNDGTRLSDENTLLIADIVVELEDGSIANVEIQKIGYQFPGERAACYSADLLLRQYKRVRDKKKKTFKYSEIKNVYTIVFFEKSPSVFQNSDMKYIHRAEAKTDTGIPLDLLQKYVFINLDIFQKSHHNKPISSKLESWLTFLSSDRIEDKIGLIEECPEFKPLYHDIYEMCQNVEEIMGLFSKELQILDENTVQFMVDEMQKEIEQQKDEIKQKDAEIEQKDAKIAELMAQIKELQTNTQ